MSFDVNKPADNQTIAQGPADIRENFRALKDDKIVNAQKLMDLTPGNASGNIPVSNGTVNTNLNADLLDGQHGSYYSPATHTHAVVTTSANGLMSNTDKQKLDGIAAGAEVNQNAFSNVKVDSTTIQADSKTDTLEIAAGTGITLNPDATNDKITISVTQDGHSHAVATTSTAGFMAAADKSKLDGIATGAEVNQNAFANVVAGGVTITADAKSDTLTINAGAGITITGDANNDALTITVTSNGHSHSDATTSAAGFMSAADKTKLNGIAAGAEVNQNAFSNVLVGGTTIAADGKTDTLELAAGANISLTPDATNDKVTIAVTGKVVSAAYADSAGSANMANNATTAESCTGNATTATKLQTARTISLAGDVSGSVSFDGSSNVTIAATVANNSHNHNISNIDGLQSALDAKIGDVGKSLTENGYQTLSTGLIIQWGVFRGASQGSITFPIAFPGACCSVQITSIGTGLTTLHNSTPTKTGFYWHDAYYAENAGVHWIAIGY